MAVFVLSFRDATFEIFYSIYVSFLPFPRLIEYRFNFVLYPLQILTQGEAIRHQPGGI